MSGKDGPKKPKRRKAGSLDESPQLATIRDVAEKFGVTASNLRAWTLGGHFPRPHIVIGRTWFYKVEVIDHKLRTGNWPQGVKFNHPLSD